MGCSPTARQLAPRLGLSEQDFSNRKKRGTLWEPIAMWALQGGYSLDFIFASDKTSSPDIGQPRLEIQSIPRFRRFVDEFSPEQYIPIPLLNHVVAHRLSSEVSTKDIEGWAMVYASQDWMPTDPEQYTCACVRDNSMRPVLEAGDIVAIDHSLKDPAALDGKMVAFHTGDGVTVRWLKFKDDVVVGVPENKDALDQVVVLKGDEIGAGIVGAVRWWWAKR